MSRKVPDGWRLTTLGEVASITMGQSPSGDSYNAEGRGVPLLNGPAEFGAISPAPVQWTTEPTKTCRAGDILFCVRGSTTGRKNIADDVYCIGRGLAAIRGGQEACTSYINYVLEQAADEILFRARGAGSTFPNINSKELAEWNTFVPPLSEQRRIAEILSSVDEGITATQAVIEQTRTLRQSVLKHLLAKGIGHTRFKQTEIGEIPEAWEVVCLRDVCESMKYGTSAKCEADSDAYPVLRIPNISGDRLDLTDLKFTELPRSEAANFLLSEGDILVIRTNGNPNYIGKMALVKGVPENALYASYLIRIRTNRRLCLPAFAVLSSQGEITRKALFESARTSAGNYNINTKGLGDAVLTLPPIREQERIIGEVSSFDDAIIAGEQELRHLNQLKSALMSDLLTGCKRVSMAEWTAAE